MDFTHSNIDGYQLYTSQLSFSVCCYFTVFITIGVTLSSCSNLTVYQSVWCKLTDLFIRWYVLPTTRVAAILKN